MLCTIWQMLCGFGLSYLQQANIERASSKLCNLIRWLGINLANLLCKMQSTKNPTLEPRFVELQNQNGPWCLVLDCVN